MTTQEQLERLTLRALFEYAQSGDQSLTATRIAPLLRNEFSNARLEMALGALERSKLVRAFYSTISPAEYEITERGYKEIESADLSETAELTGGDLAPGSDRIVRFNDNSPDHEQSLELLKQITDAVKGDNSLDEVTHNRLLSGLQAALVLWRAVELKIIQIRVGILLAIEDVKPWAKDKFYDALLAGALALVRNFIKNRLGINF